MNFSNRRDNVGLQVRTSCYQRAIEGNPDLFRDKIILDIGCGTGILSIFAARAGAKHVYGVEYATIAYKVKTSEGLEAE
jgi:type I protein arginine methyltransferase